MRATRVIHDHHEQNTKGTNAEKKDATTMAFFEQGALYRTFRKRKNKKLTAIERRSNQAAK